MRSCVLLAVAAGCGRGASSPAAIRLEPVVAEQAWYRPPAPCGQGPFELELPATEARWGEEIELRLATPRKLALHAVVIADGVEVGHGEGIFDGAGLTSGAPDNAKCVADVHEQLAAARGGTGGSTPASGPVTTPAAVAPTTAPVALVPDATLAPESHEVIHFSWDGHTHRRMRVQVWSVDPNDLAGVRFGIARIEWKPNVSDAEYEAFLARQQAAHVPTASVAAETDAERRAREDREAADRRRELEVERRRAIAEALEAQRAAAHEAFCARHAEDRDCWGAGGRRVHDDLARHDAERAAYCATAPEDARCWSPAEWGTRRAAYSQRVALALAPPKPPEGPPPAPLAEELPPKLSQHAEWRPGYWQWTGATWTWLGGMWRVPDSDIAAQLTTTAPAAPPPLRAEPVSTAPMRALVWLPGFWQWSGVAWVWVAGSWQRAESGARWRAAEWREHGAVHILIPGQWVRP